MKNEYTTGEFAKLCKISKKTLFHYDKIGLLSPARVNDRGYRFYSLYQIDKVSTIKLFQELGLSLKGIQEMLELKDINLKSSQLAAQKQVISKKIAELQKMGHRLDFLTARFDHFQKVGVDRLYQEIQEKDEYYFVEDKSEQGVSVNYLNYGDQYGVLFKEESLGKELGIPKHSYVFQRTEKKKSNFIKPKGNYISILHLLTNEEIMHCVPKFLKQVDKMKTTGPLYHEDYCSEIAGYPEQFVIKLSMKIE